MGNVRFNFESYLLKIGAIKCAVQRAASVGMLKVTEYEYGDYQFVTIANEFGLKTTLIIMQHWDVLETKYCAGIPRTETFAKELIEHLVNKKDGLDVGNLN